MRRIAWGIVLCVGAGGCQPSPWSTIEQEETGGFRPSQDRYLVIRDSTAWAFLYHWAHAGSSASSPAVVPTVDFGSNVVLACMLSKRPSGGYAVEFTTVEWNATNLQAKAYVKETPPAPGSSVGPSLTYPYAFARLSADPQDTVQFAKNAALPVPGTETKYKDLVQQDFTNRNPFLLPAAPPQHLSALNTGKCPLEGTPLAVTSFMAEAISNGFSAVFALQAHFCPKDGGYWTNGATPSGAQNWNGPFHPGVYILAGS